MKIFENSIDKYNYLKDYIKWILKNKPLPPPHIVKQMTIREYKRRFHLDIFIESGTFMGEMVFTQRNHFRTIVSIELSKLYYENAKRRFSENKNIEIVFGDSGEIIKEIVPRLPDPAIFWLDGHYSGGETAKSNVETPIMAELNAIFSSAKNHVILIDDARLFNGQDDYPTMEFLKEYSERNTYTLSVKDDIIRLIKG